MDASNQQTDVQMNETDMHDVKAKALNHGHDLLTRTNHFKHIHGCNKLIKKIQAEIKFLQSVSKDIYSSQGITMQAILLSA